MGAAARAAAVTAKGVGVGLERRLGGEQPVALPWGLAPRNEDAPADQAYANLALARYAESLRRRRGQAPDPELRGLPLLVRRDGGTATGATAGPGGLARSFVPVEHQVRPDITRAVKGERPRTGPSPGAHLAGTPAPAPLAAPPARRAGGR